MDEFARIAAEEYQENDVQLIEPGPETGEPESIRLEKALPETKPPDVPSFAEREEQLREELSELRTRMQGFLGNQAPKNPFARDTVALKAFDCRLLGHAKMEAFGQDFNAEVEWQQVEVPHYSSPVGVATRAYRTRFSGEIIRCGASESLWICCESIDYKARLYLNGAYVGEHTGFFEPFAFDISCLLRDGENELLILVENDFPCKGFKSGLPEHNGESIEGDKIYAATGPGWDDPELGWHHCPPGMGIIGDVYLEKRSRVFVSDVFIRPLSCLKRIAVSVQVESANMLPEKVEIDLAVHGKNFMGERISLIEGMEVVAGKGSNRFELEMDIPEARLWNPDTPWMYELQATLRSPQGSLIDGAIQTFGMRTITMDEYRGLQGMFFLNGQPLKLRGANTMGHEQQCVMQGDIDQLVDDILLCKLANMNFLRLTQRPVQRKVYELCDRLGMMTQTDLPLFGHLKRNLLIEASRQAGAMERLVRNHPCNALLSFINEPFGENPEKEIRHLDRQELMAFFRIASEVVRLENPDRVIKPVDGDYAPPSPGLPDNHCYCCWYNGHGLAVGKLHRGYWVKVKPGWYYACGEFGSEGLDPVDLMKRRYPKEWLPQSEREEETWTPSEIVSAQVGNFYPLWYERPSTLNGWVEHSQQHQAWSTRLMTEAFRRDPRMVSFAIHLGIDAFPSGWMKALMDCERRPKPAWFAYRDALQAVLLALRSDRWGFFSGEQAHCELWVCNDLEDQEGVQLEVCLSEGDTCYLAASEAVSLEGHSARYFRKLSFGLPEVSERRTVSLSAVLRDASGNQISQSNLELQVFPANRSCPDGCLPIGDAASRLLEQAGLSRVTELSHTRVAIVSDMDAYARDKASIDTWIREGGRCLFMNLAQQTHAIADLSITIDECHFYPVNFLHRNTGHPMVKAFEPRDFFFWYDEACDYASPICSTAIENRELEDILVTGDVRWGRPFADDQFRPVVAETRVGDGRVIISQIELLNRVRFNPVARGFFLALLGSDSVSTG